MPRLLTLDHVPLPAAALLESDATRSRGSVSEAVDAIVNAALAQHAAQVRANASTSTPLAMPRTGTLERTQASQATRSDSASGGRGAPPLALSAPAPEPRGCALAQVAKQQAAHNQLLALLAAQLEVAKAAQRDYEGVTHKAERLFHEQV